MRPTNDMNQPEELLLEPLLQESNVRRRDLLPIWMKIFVWIFLITGALAPLILLIGLSGGTVQLALYGLETTELQSATGLILVSLFLFKGLVAFGLWFEKDWAVHLGVIDAVLGIAACVYVMFVLPLLGNHTGPAINIRLELVALIPYLVKLQRIKPLWQRR